jgi:hypothetical protein
VTVRVSVDPWDPSYGSALSEAVLNESTARVALDLEIPADSWLPIAARTDSWQPSEVLIVDGVRRIDARIWFTPPGDSLAVMGIAASYAAGVVKIDGQAHVSDVRVERGVYTNCPEASDLVTAMATYPVVHTAGDEFDDLVLAVQNHMRELELAAALAERTREDDLLVLDGPLRGRTTIPRTLGYIKAHHAAYLPPELNAVVASLTPAQRTPVFTIGTTWSRHTWYLRLPFESSSPWAGVVRCEAADTLSRSEVIQLADASVVVLPRLASEAHKDPRAPQNLVPIGGLEKILRHRLGDPLKLHRTLTAYARTQPA